MTVWKGLFMEKYIEKRIELEKTIDFDEATNLCEGDCYCLYEDNHKISIGIGCHISIIVTDRHIIIEDKNGMIQETICDLCEDLYRILSSIPLKNWRSYGIANFSLARFIYKLDVEHEKSELLRLFIPQKEIRIDGKRVLLRALNKNDLYEMEKVIATTSKDVNHTKCDKYIDATKVVNYDKEYYKKIVAIGVKEIQEDKYQKLILSRKVPLTTKLSMKATYIKGRQANTPARSYLCRFEGLEVAGFSPETVAEVDQNGIVYTFPLAGTRAFTADVEKNEKLRNELLYDTKEIAEHAISVRLAAEEMQEICDAKTVAVIHFMSIIERGTVQHLGSRLRGNLKSGLNSWHAFCKLFPAVTASGIPKKEAIEAIGRIEREPRNLYSGSVLIYDENGSLDGALVLRSIYQTDNESWVQVGAGIVNMSNPDREYVETQEKVSCIASHLVADN